MIGPNENWPKRKLRQCFVHQHLPAKKWIQHFRSISLIFGTCVNAQTPKDCSMLCKKLPDCLHLEQHPYVNWLKMMAATLLFHCHCCSPPPPPTATAATITIIAVVVVIVAVTVTVSVALAATTFSWLLVFCLCPRHCCCRRCLCCHHCRHRCCPCFHHQQSPLPPLPPSPLPSPAGQAAPAEDSDGGHHGQVRWSLVKVGPQRSNLDNILLNR